MRSRSVQYYVLGAGLASGLLACLGVLAQAQNGGGQARDTALRNTCMSQMKQLSLGMMMYTEDYDRQYPPAGKWSKAILPYVKKNDLYNCPADNGKNSYAMNRNLDRRKLTTVSAPAKMPLLFESNQHKADAAGLAAEVAKPPRHAGGNDFAYVDGHVKWEQKTPGFGSPTPKNGRKR